MSAALPGGIVTFLFTDVEGSSALWERSEGAMRRALAEHDAELRAAVQGHGGVVFKTVGDAFCCAFAGPHDALASAIDAQHRLAAHAWPAEIGALRVRMGIHSGHAVARDGDYFGPVVNRVARLMAIGSGGQVLVSSASAALLSESDGAGGLIDLGVHRLRDLSRAEPVFQVVADGLPRDFPPLQSVDARPNNLPSQFSSFIGRERESAELRERLTGSRLLTVTGSGGIGKTRLALHVAAMNGDFSDGIWFVELSAVADPRLVSQTVARAIGIRPPPGETVEQSLLQHLRSRHALLLVDNCEQVLGGVAALAKTLLAACPRVTLLVTSREPLHLAGEQVYRLESMPESTATRLFLDRARAAQPSLDLEQRDAADIAGICEQLQGIPLAIELAAARVATLSIRQLNERLSRRLSVLTSRDSTLERHRTLRAAIDWSYRLLLDDEKVLFARLSVFAGGFTLDAGERIAGPIDSPVDAIESLVEKSLVQMDDAPSERRFRLLDTVREFASERLAQSGATAGDAYQAHGRYYAALAARGRAVRGDGSVAWHKAIDEDRDNLRAAIRWYAQHDPMPGAQIALDLEPYWRARGTSAEAGVTLGALMGSATIDAPMRAALQLEAAGFATLQDDFSAGLALANEALTYYRAIGDDAGVGQAIFRIAEVEHRKGRLEEAEGLYRQAHARALVAGNLRAQLLCAANSGVVARQRGRYEAAGEMLRDALAQAEASGESRIATELSIHLAWVEAHLGDVASSGERFGRVFARSRADEDPYGTCAAQCGLGTIALMTGRLEEAYTAFAATVATAYALRLHAYVFRGFDGIAAVFALQGRMDEAVRYVGLAERTFRETHRELRDSIAYDMVEKALSALPGERRRALERVESDVAIETTLAELPASTVFSTHIAVDCRSPRTR